MYKYSTKERGDNLESLKRHGWNSRRKSRKQWDSKHIM